MQDIKTEMIYWARRLYAKNMCPSTSGNISVKTKQGILISASGVCLNDMTPNDIILTDMSANPLEKGKKPSSECIMHSEIYFKRDDINAIIHVHCPVIGAFAVAGVEMDKPILPDFVLKYGKVPVVPYYCPSTIELAQAVGEYFDKYDAVLLKNHGVVVGASSLKQAFYDVELLRYYAETWFGAEVLGGAKLISKKGVAQIKKLIK
ncbi:class II aldolase/adducin family protein [bacterium]|nr:class II aldolase/adducin family protein [bacterium]